MSELLASELISDALQEIGALGIGETATAEDSAIALRHFNRLIQSHNIFKSSIHAIRMDTKTLTIAKQSYTWGVDPDGVLTADIALTRLTFISNIILRYQSTPTIQRMAPMVSLTDKQWAALSINDAAGIPNSYYWDKAYPLGTLYFNPVADAAYVVELWTAQKGARLLLTDIVSYPDGYEDFWLYNLARRLCGPYRKVWTATQQADLEAANNRIVEHNSIAPDLESDVAASFGGGGRFDWRSGSSD